MAKDFVPYEGPVVTRAEALAQGLEWYFNGKVCKHGHLAIRRTSSKACQGCCSDKLAAARATTAARPKRPETKREEARRLGKTRYFTGKPCRAGHIAERFVNSRACYVCSRLHAQALPKERLNAYHREWRARNPDKFRKTCAKHNALHRERRAEQGRIAYAKDPLKGRARAKAWRIANPNGIRAHAQTRNARKKGCEGSYTADDVIDLLRLQKRRCANCRTKLKKYHVDHIHPLSKGGRNDRGNLQILCESCNLRKHASDPIVWAQRNGRLL